MHRSLKSTLHFSVSYFGITAIISVPFTVKAQEEDKPGSGFEEIIVTARKRSQSLQDVPVSIQAIDTDALREKSIRDFDDYVRELTSVSFGTSGPGATTIAFRGALSQPSGFDAISSSILYLDEVPITRDGQNPDVRIVDIERLEALAGPQPTIYGAGSQSGTLKIVTVKPDMEGFSGWVEGSLSATRDGEPSYSLSAALNIPIVEDKLAIRLVGFNDAEGGFIDNVFGTTAFYSENNGDRDNADFVEENVNDYDVIGARAIVRYEPNEKWSIETGIIYQEAVVEGLFDFNPDAGFLNTVKFKDEQRVDDWYNATLTIEGDLGFADLTLAGGFHSRNIDYTFDNTAYMTAYRDVGLGIVYYVTGGSTNFDDACYYGPGYFCAAQYYDFGPNPTGTINLEQRVRSFVQEVRLTSKEDSESRFSWLIGAFYERTNNDYDYISRVDDLAEFATNAFAAYANYNPGQNIQPSDIWFDQGFIEGQTYNGLPGNDFNGFISDIESIAVFGEVSFDVTDQLTVTAGGRWFSTDFRVAENSLFLGQVSDNFDETRTTKDFSPRVNVTFEPNDDILMYFTYAEGARIGGRNGGVQTPLQMSLVPDAFDGDVLANYEIGIKSSWFDNRFIANVTAFMMNWKDFQVQTNIPIAGASVVNAGNASIDGVEGQFAFKATENWEFSTAFTYLDARLDDDVILANGTLVAGNAGDALPATPSWQASVSAQYDKPLSIGEDLEAYGRVDLYHTGSAINGTNASVALFGAQTATPETIPSYESGYLSFGVRKKDDWQIWLAVNNFWDEQAVTWIAPRFSDGRSYALRPREFVLGFYKPF